MSPGNVGSYVFLWLPKRFFFHWILFDIRNLDYLGGFTGKISSQKVKKKI